MPFLINAGSRIDHYILTIKDCILGQLKLFYDPKQTLLIIRGNWHSPKGFPIIPNHISALACRLILWFLFRDLLWPFPLHQEQGRRCRQSPREERASAQFLFCGFSSGYLVIAAVPLCASQSFSLTPQTFAQGAHSDFENTFSVVTSFSFAFSLKIRTPEVAFSFNSEVKWLIFLQLCTPLALNG